MNDILGIYRNGNYNVVLLSDGTKVRHNNYDIFIPKFPESIDCKITNSCNMGCPMCHEESVSNGKHADLFHPLFDSLHPYTELALGGGNVLEHPDLESFLVKMRDKKVICNMTLHLNHFLEAYDYVRYLQEENLIHGVGVSVNSVIDKVVVDKIASTPNTVVHTIAGIMNQAGYEALFDNGIKLLILGYKDYGRGTYYIKKDHYIDARIEMLHSCLVGMMTHFKLISFDNLAIDQLCVKELVGDDAWEKSYMGDDGQFTMYLDMVEKTFSKSSISERVPIYSNNIKDLFSHVLVVQSCIGWHKSKELSSLFVHKSRDLCTHFNVKE